MHDILEKISVFCIKLTNDDEKNIANGKFYFINLLFT